jgi:hypothetical protein
MEALAATEHGQTVRVRPLAGQVDAEGRPLAILVADDASPLEGTARRSSTGDHESARARSSWLFETVNHHHTGDRLMILQRLFPEAAEAARIASRARLAPLIPAPDDLANTLGPVPGREWVLSIADALGARDLSTNPDHATKPRSA